MDLTPYVEQLRRQLSQSVDAAGEEVRVAAEQLTSSLDAAVRLTLLDALSAATEEVTRDLAPGAVDLRLRGREPEFVVTRPQAPAGPTAPTPPPTPDAPSAVPQPAAAGEVGAEEEPGGDAEQGTSRITLRLPEALKARAEQAAAREGLSVNSWLVRAVRAALGQARSGRSGRGPGGVGQRLTGWVR